MSVRLLVALGLFTALVVVRTRHVAETFWLLGDQVRDWTIALGPWRDLPLVGPQSSVGGHTIGPVFYWTLWIVRHVIGPWTDDLPHAGGIGLSVIQSAADAVLLLALWRRTTSLALALAVTLLVATAPYDMALTATIWNPPLAVALVKVAIALALSAPAGAFATGRRVALTTACAWLAVQAHASAIFVSAPLIASYPVHVLIARQGRLALKQAAIALSVVVALQIPFFVDRARDPARPAGPTLVMADVRHTITHPGDARPFASWSALATAAGLLLAGGLSTPAAGVLLLACIGLATYRARRDVTLLAVSVAPLGCAVAGFATWQRAFDHYWYLALMPSVALSVGVAARLPGRLGALPLLALVLLMQPGRLTQTMSIHRLPEYGPLSRGSRAIYERTREVAAIETDFDLPASSDREFLYRVLGGRVVPSAGLTARIDREGHVSYREAPPRGAAAPPR